MYNQQVYSITAGHNDMYRSGDKLMATAPPPGQLPPELASSQPTSKRATFIRFLPTIINVIIAVDAIVVLLLLELGILPQHKVGFYCQDPLLSFPFNGDSVSIATLLIVASLFPLLIVYFVERWRCGDSWTKSVKPSWVILREYWIGLTALMAIIEVSKAVIGEHRPHFFHTCAPDTSFNCTKGTYVNDFKCTNTKYSNYLILDSSRSFPSGHSAVGIFSGLFCAWFVQKRLCPLPCRLVVPCLQTLCVLWGVVCSLTRITDHRHHWWDVLAGVALGIFATVYTIKYLFRDCDSSPPPRRSSTRPSASTVTLLDVANRNATSVVL